MTEVRKSSRIGSEPSAIDPARIARSCLTRQHGLLSSSQVLTHPEGSAWLRRSLRSGELLLVERGVYRSAETPETWETRASAACLARGATAVLSHASAARVFGLELPTWREQRIEVTVGFSAGGRSSERVRVYRSRRLEHTQRANYAGLRVTTAQRTIVDLAGAGLEQPRLERLVDDAILNGKVQINLLQSVLTAPSHRMRPGVEAVRRVLSAWLEGPMESHAEAHVVRKLLRAGFPSPIRQYEIRTSTFRARVDFAWPDWRVLLEVDGFGPHSGARRFYIDRHRRNQLEALGWRVVTTTQREVSDDNAAVFAVLRMLLAPGLARPALAQQ